jgi:hypothetical protein
MPDPGPSVGVDDLRVIGSVVIPVNPMGCLMDMTLEGQLTACSWKGIPCFVREGLDGSQSFLVSSGERWGFKFGRVAMSRQALFLAAPDEHWAAIAQVVATADRHHRPVKRHARFDLCRAREIYLGVHRQLGHGADAGRRVADVALVRAS